MIETIEELKEQRSDLVELFEGMTKEQLLNQCYLECIDALNMEERVAIFMSECTNNMSKTDYSISAISALINQKKELDIELFCYYICEEQSDDDILKAIKNKCLMYKKKIKW